MITAPHLHAMVIHFPIALLIVGFLSETIGQFSKNKFFSYTSFYLLIIGTIAAIVAYVTGNYAGNGMTDISLQGPLGMHEEAALVTLFLSTITLLVKASIYFFHYEKTWAMWLMIILYLMLVSSIARTAYLGGNLVFKYGAGIELIHSDYGT